MANPLVSCHAEAFPAGLQVLVVDDDSTWLKILEKMLRKCLYEVTTCGRAREALDLLHDKRDRFDIVISDVNMPDMDGFKLLELIGLQMDLPVIMMSVDGETSKVMKGIQHGACDYLLKPVRMKELRNIWRHVYRKRVHEAKDTECHDILDGTHFFRGISEDVESRTLLSGSDISSPRKRKDEDSKENPNLEFTDPCAAKKARVVWSVGLHCKFVNAVNQTGLDKVGPEKILDLMNVPGLTSENVASHLQKYRLYLARIQTQNGGRTCGGNKEAPKNSNQTETSTRHTPNSSFPSHQIISDVKINETKSMVPLQFSCNNTISGTQIVNGIPQLDFKGAMPSSEHKLHDDFLVPKNEPRNRAPQAQFMQYLVQNHEGCCLLDDYTCMPKPDQEKHVLDHLSVLAPSIISVTSYKDEDVDTLCELKPVVADCFAGLIATLNFQASEQRDSTDELSSINKLYLGKNNIQECLQPATYELGLKGDCDLDYFLGNLHLGSSCIGCFKNLGLNTLKILHCSDSASTANGEANCDHLYDQLDYSAESFSFHS